MTKDDRKHVETETVKTKSSITKEATSAEEGIRTYTAVFENPAFETQIRQETILKTDPELDNGQTVTAKGQKFTVTKMASETGFGEVTFARAKNLKRRLSPAARRDRRSRPYRSGSEPET